MFLEIRMCKEEVTDGLLKKVKLRKKKKLEKITNISG